MHAPARNRRLRQTGTLAFATGALVAAACVGLLAGFWVLLLVLVLLVLPLVLVLSEELVDIGETVGALSPAAAAGAVVAEPVGATSIDVCATVVVVVVGVVGVVNSAGSASP
jgi:hypothetical protein